MNEEGYRKYIRGVAMLIVGDLRPIGVREVAL
jgi:hypothetical protein